MIVDYYLVLGLERSASTGEIKRAYRRLARRYHPDINPGDRLAAAEFRRIAEAYETLSDPDRRHQYDVAGSGVQREPEVYGFEGFDFSMSVGGPLASTFGDLFAEVLTPGARTETGEPERGADLHHTLDLSFEAALHGGPQRVTVTRHEHCRTCRGTGILGTAELECSLCHGTGAVKSARGHMVFSKPCPPCRGTGRRVGTACRACGGQQTELRTETLVVNVPAGLADGARIRISGKGHVGRNGAAPGDLYVTARVGSHPLFRREGDDLHLVVPVAVHEAALGARLEIPALEGRAKLRVPPGTQSGQRFRLRERGVPSSRDGRRGDLIVEIRLVLPKVLDERSKELLREFGRLNADDVRRELTEQLPPVGEQAS
jgi:molecular chaperone DnaJ